MLAVVALLAAAVVWFLVREPAPGPAAAPPPVPVGAPGADVVVDLGPAVERCPAGATCTYATQVTGADEQTFRAAFGSAGYIGRQSVVDADTGEVYLQLIRFTTGQLVTVTLSQQPLARLAAPPVVDDTVSDAERASGAVTVTAVRDGYLMTANAAGLPGQVLPVRSAQQWVQSVPAP